MSLTKVEQYRTSSGISITPTRRSHPYNPLRAVLTDLRQAKSVLSSNPLLRIKQSESLSTPTKARVMAEQQPSNPPKLPTAASQWTKETLDLLSAVHHNRQIIQFAFNEKIQIPEALKKSISHTLRVLRTGVAQISAEVRTVNDGEEIDSEYEFDRDNFPSLHDFPGFYGGLSQTLMKDPKDKKRIRKRRATSIASISTTSNDSKLEARSHGTANDFLYATYLATNLGKYRWGYDQGYRIDHYKFPSCLQRSLIA